MALNALIQGYMQQQDRKIQAAQQAATQQFKQSEFKLRQAQAESDAKETQQRLDYEKQRIEIEKTAQERLERQADETARHHKEDEKTAGQRVENTAKSNLLLAEARQGKIDQQTQTNYIRVYQSEHDKAKAAGASETEAHDIAAKSAEIIISQGKAAAAGTPVNPEFIKGLLKGLDPYGASPKAQQAAQKATDQHELAIINQANQKETLETIKQRNTNLKLDATLKQTENLLKISQNKKIQQDIQQKAALFPYTITELAQKIAERSLDIESKKVKAEVEKAIPGQPTEEQMKNPRFRATMQKVMQMRFDAIGKVKERLEGVTEKEHEHLSLLKHQSEVTPADPTKVDSWRIGNGPDGIYTKEIKGATAHLRELNRNLSNINMQYNQLEVMATDPETGWVLPTGADGKPDKEQGKALHEAAKKRAIDAAGEYSRLSSPSAEAPTPAPRAPNVTLPTPMRVQPGTTPIPHAPPSQQQHRTAPKSLKKAKTRTYNRATGKFE